MQLPEQDHYEIARNTALERLKEGLDRPRLERLGVRLSEGENVLTVPLLCWEVAVRLEPCAVTLKPGGQEVAIAWQILVLNYMGARNPEPPHGFLSFADFSEGRGYQSAFEGRVNQRLSHTAGRNRETFVAAVDRLGGTLVEGEPDRCMFRFFPLLEFQVVRYEGDEDFPPSCNVLLPDNALDLFSMEDTIVAAERLVAALDGRTPAARPEEAEE
ncbi:MAG: DUF3786 domain-containing protein [Candidatus Brocadiia bacterium]